MTLLDNIEALITSFNDLSDCIITSYIYESPVMFMKGPLKVFRSRMILATFALNANAISLC